MSKQKLVWVFTFTNDGKQPIAFSSREKLMAFVGLEMDIKDLEGGKEQVCEQTGKQVGVITPMPLVG